MVMNKERIRKALEERIRKAPELGETELCSDFGRTQIGWSDFGRTQIGWSDCKEWSEFYDDEEEQEDGNNRDVNVDSSDSNARNSQK